MRRTTSRSPPKCCSKALEGALGAEAPLLGAGVERLVAARADGRFDPTRSSDPARGAAFVQGIVADLVADRPPPWAGSEAAPDGEEPDEASPAVAQAALRARCAEAFASAGWEIATAGPDLVLLDGRVRLQVAGPHAVRLHALVARPGLDSDEDLEALNEASGLAPDFVRYRSGAGTTELGVLLRLAIPDPPPPAREMARWLECQAHEVSLASDALGAVDDW